MKIASRSELQPIHDSFFKFIFQNPRNIRNLSRNRILLTAMGAVARREVRANLERLLRELADLIITHERDFKEEIEMFLKMSILYIQQVGKIDNTEIKEILIDGRDEKLRTIIDELMEEGLQ